VAGVTIEAVVEHLHDYDYDNDNENENGAEGSF